jgi:Tfp pilus assembly protein PilF
MARVQRICSIALLSAACLLAGGNKDNKLELRGRVTGLGHVIALRGRLRFQKVMLYSVETPFIASTFTDPGGGFRFHDLPPGNYVVALIRRQLGEVRRTVVVSSGLADRKGVVHMTIYYTAAEAAADASQATVSKEALTVPNRAWNKYQDALKHLEKRETDKARRSLEEAVKIAPQFVAAWNSLGVIAYQTHDLSQAEKDFREALAVEPDAFEPTVNLGGVLLSQGRTEEALPYNQKAVAEHPNNALANAQLGMNYYQLGNYEKAEPALVRVQRHDPSHFSQPQLYLARIYARRGENRRAARELRDFLRRHPDDPNAGQLQQRVAELEKPSLSQSR